MQKTTTAESIIRRRRVISSSKGKRQILALPNKWKPDHAQRVIRSLELHIFPDLATRKIDEIMPLEVLGLLQRLESARKYDTAQKIYDVVNQVFKYAVKLRLACSIPPPNYGESWQKWSRNITASLETRKS